MVTTARRRPFRAALALALPMVATLGLLSATPATADEMRKNQYWLDAYGITKAWESTKGAGVKVAVIDSGVDGSHPDLKGAVVGGTDVSGSGTPNGQKGIGDEPVHGTLVASLLAGRGHGGEKTDNPKPDGVVGVAPEAQLLTVSTWLGSPNPSGKSIDEQIPQAVRWAVDNGAKVINMSLSSTSPAWPASWDSAFLYAEQHDVVIIAAAGNREAGLTQVGAPATIPGVVAVAGLKKDGTSSQGSSTQGITIAVSAPAEALVGAVPGTGYANWSGSSGAAPIVAGVAALIRSKYPEMKAAQVINRILLSAKHKGDAGHNSTYGYGALDADAAVNADIAPVNVSPLPSLQDWITIHRRNEPSSPPATTASKPPVTAGPTLPEPTTPVALPPSQLDSGVPAAIIIGFGVLLLLVIAGGVVHLSVLRRRSVTERGSQDTS